MIFYLDTANLDKIKELVPYKFCSGITTNPSLAMKEGVSSYKILIKDIVCILKEFKKPLSIEVFTNEPDKIYSEAMELMEAYDYCELYIKVPINYENIKIIENLKKNQIKINCTCVFSLTQVLMCIQSEVEIISLFYNRIKDQQDDPNRIIKISKNIINKLNSKSKILLGSIRKLKDIEEGCENGADIATIPPHLFIESCINEGSEKSIQQFMNDVKKIKI